MLQDLHPLLSSAMASLANQLLDCSVISSTAKKIPFSSQVCLQSCEPRWFWGKVFLVFHALARKSPVLCGKAYVHLPFETISWHCNLLTLVPAGIQAESLGGGFSPFSRMVKYCTPFFALPSPDEIAR